MSNRGTNDTLHSGQPDPAAVLCQLGRIRASRGFRNAPKLSAFLVFVVEETLAGRDDNVTGRVIATHVFGRGSDFRSDEDAVVRATATRLRRTLDLYYATEGALDDVVIRLERGSYRPVIRARRNGGPASVSQGLIAADAYQSIATPGAHASALALVLAELRETPEDPELLATCADLRLDAYKHGLDLSRGQLDEACGQIEEAARGEPHCPRVLRTKAFVALELGDLTEVASLGRLLCQAAGGDERTRAAGAWFRDISGDGLAGPRDHGRASLPLEDAPGWFHLPGFLAAYDEGDFETALGEAMDFGMPGFFWGAICRASALGQLGLSNAAFREIKRLVAQNPHFPRTPERFLKCYIADPDVRAHVQDGLCRAGLRHAT